jgi:hypothetical protein
MRQDRHAAQPQVPPTRDRIDPRNPPARLLLSSLPPLSPLPAPPHPPPEPQPPLLPSLELELPLSLLPLSPLPLPLLLPTWLR